MSAHVRVAPPKDYASRPGRAPFKLQRDWDPHGIRTPPPDDTYRSGHARTFGEGRPGDQYCPTCDLRTSWCECSGQEPHEPLQPGDDCRP